MNLTTLLSAGAANGNGTAVTLDTTPFVPGQPVIVVISASIDWNGDISVQGSDDDGSSYTDSVAAITGTNARKARFVQVNARGLMRTVIANFVAGTVDVHLMAAA